VAPPIAVMRTAMIASRPTRTNGRRCWMPTTPIRPPLVERSSSSVRPVNRTGTFALLLRNACSAELRRVQFANAGFSISEHATWLAVLFFALERGGSREVGLVAFIQLSPSVVLTPFSSYAGDRFRPQRALASGYAIQSMRSLRCWRRAGRPGTG